MIDGGEKEAGSKERKEGGRDERKVGVLGENPVRDESLTRPVDGRSFYAEVGEVEGRGDKVKGGKRDNKNGT